jgi:hypothetical protein
MPTLSPPPMTRRRRCLRHQRRDTDAVSITHDATPTLSLPPTTQRRRCLHHGRRDADAVSATHDATLSSPSAVSANHNANASAVSANHDAVASTVFAIHATTPSRGDGDGDEAAATARQRQWQGSGDSNSNAYLLDRVVAVGVEGAAAREVGRVALPPPKSASNFARSIARFDENLPKLFPPAAAELPASGGQPDLDMALDIFRCKRDSTPPPSHHEEKRLL